MCGVASSGIANTVNVKLQFAAALEPACTSRLKSIVCPLLSFAFPPH